MRGSRFPKGLIWTSTHFPACHLGLAKMPIFGKHAYVQICWKCGTEGSVIRARIGLDEVNRLRPSGQKQFTPGKQS
jgi:hypothetical protein